MKKNVVVIGYGGQGGWHCDQILKSDVVNLAGVYDIKPERNELAESRGIKAYASLDDVLADDSVDIITVAIPNDVHSETVIKSLKAGKHVICEKPVEMSLAAVDKMIAASKEAGKLFTVHQNRRWDVDFLAMKQIKESGEIGKILNIESRIHGSRGIPSDWRCEKAHGGGMILDWGVHLIDQMLQLFPEPIESVYCETTNYTKTECDDGCKIVIKVSTGARIYIEVGTYNFLPLPRFYCQCEKGTAIIQDWKEECKIGKLKAWNEKEVVPVETASGITKTMAPRDEITLDTYTIPRPHSDVHDFYRNFVKAIDGEEEQIVKHQEIRRVMHVMECAFKSAELNQVVPFDEP